MKIARRGVTLIELLIVIAIVATLTAIMIPVLRQLVVVRKDMQDLSNLRQTMIDYFGYAADHRGRIVNAGLPTHEESKWFYGDFWNSPVGVNLYRGQSSGWTKVLARWSGPFGPHWHSSYEDFLIDHPTLGIVHLAEIAGDRIYQNPSKYRLSSTMLTEADIWTFPGQMMSVQEFGERGMKVVRFEDVATPSRKGILIHREHPREAHGLNHIAFADGSVSIRSMDEGAPTAAHPLATTPDWRGTPVSSTLNGYLGVDF